jgi:hypothetical protein
MKTLHTVHFGFSFQTLKQRQSTKPLHPFDLYNRNSCTVKWELKRQYMLRNYFEVFHSLNFHTLDIPLITLTISALFIPYGSKAVGPMS